MIVRVSERSTRRFIAVPVGVVIFGGIWAIVVMFVLDSADTVIGEASVRLFSLDGELGFPAAFTALLLLIAAGAIWLSNWAVLRCVQCPHGPAS